MTLKTRIWLTAAWLALVMAVAVGGIVSILQTSTTKQQADTRAERLGLGLGIFAGLGAAGLWLPWAMERGRQQRAGSRSTAPPGRPKRL